MILSLNENRNLQIINDIISFSVGLVMLDKKRKSFFMKQNKHQTKIKVKLKLVWNKT